MYVKKKTEVKEINFLKSQRYEAFTYQADPDMDGVENGRLPAGSVYPKNDATAIGITMNEVNLAEGAQPVSVIVDAHILKDRLPVAPDAAAITAMRQISFY